MTLLGHQWAPLKSLNIHVHLSENSLGRVIHKEGNVVMTDSRSKEKTPNPHILFSVCTHYYKQNVEMYTLKLKCNKKYNINKRLQRAKLIDW